MRCFGQVIRIATVVALAFLPFDGPFVASQLQNSVDFGVSVVVSRVSADVFHCDMTLKSRETGNLIAHQRIDLRAGEESRSTSTSGDVERSTWLHIDAEGKHLHWIIEFRRGDTLIGTNDTEIAIDTERGASTRPASD